MGSSWFDQQSPRVILPLQQRLERLLSVESEVDLWSKEKTALVQSANVLKETISKVLKG